jgi:hypothetical protein
VGLLIVILSSAAFAASGKLVKNPASKEFDGNATVVDAFKAKEITIRIKADVPLVEDPAKGYNQRDPELTLETGRLTCNLRRVSDLDKATLTKKKTWTAKEMASKDRLVDDNELTATLELEKTGEEILFYCSDTNKPYFFKILDTYSDATRAEQEERCRLLNGRFEFLSKDQLPKNFPALNTYKLETKFAKCDRSDRNTTYDEMKELFRKNGMEIQFKTAPSRIAAEELADAQAPSPGKLKPLVKGRGGAH